ncbi:MAG TPA: DUF6427 family protein [Cyclobacteriaceae bacterium]|nr:DUF6427 family protein [Cyclobacteriaceae bacterium]
MLLRFFRINDPYRLIGLFIIIVLISLPFLIMPVGIMLSELKNLVLGQAIAEGKLMYVQVFDDTPPLASVIYGLMHLIFGKSLLAGHIMAIFIIIFQSSYFATLLINNKAYAENTYLPSLIFGLLCFFSFDLLSFSPELLASTVLLFALNQLFHEVEFKIQRDEITLKLGVYLGLTTFLVFSYWVFLLLTIFILITFSRAGFRKIALVVFGFMLPHALLFTLYYYKGATDLLWTNFYLSNLTFSGEMLISTKGLFVLAAVPLVYFVFSVFMMNREARFTKYQSQLMQIMFLWLLFALIQVLLARQVSPASLIPFIPPLAYFISHYLLLIRRKWRSELMLWLFLGGIVSVNLFSRSGKIVSVDFTSLFPIANPYNQIREKRVLMLYENLNVYQHNSLGGYFLDWELSSPLFTDLSKYDHIEMISSCFKEDPPEVIIDKNNMMEGVIQRIPAIGLAYRKDGNIYRRISN